MKYIWDEEKNRRNLRLHGIAFEDAILIFDGPTVEGLDDPFDYGEDGVYTIGLVNGLEFTVIYADNTKKDERRIISAWQSEPRERRHYWQNIGT